MTQEVKKKGHMYLSFENKIPKIVSAQQIPEKMIEEKKLIQIFLKIPLILLVVS